MDIQTITTPSTTPINKIFLIINCILVAIGNTGGPLLMRLYFINGGKRIWLSCFLQSSGWPLLLIPLTIAYINRASSDSTFFIKPKLFATSSVIGIFIGIDNYLFAAGLAKIPVSTSALIVGTQLIFTSTFAFFIVKQRFNAYSINAVVLLTVGAVILGVHANGDRPRGESEREYLLGFFMTISAAALYGVITPVVQLMYSKAEQRVTYALVLQIQMVICFFAMSFCTTAMLINHDFQAIPREAKAYSLGMNKYYLVLVSSPVIWQCFFLGVIGVIFYGSALLSGVIITVTIPLTGVLGVIFYHENFQAEKGISLFLSLWGFFSYFYGEITNVKRNKAKMMTANSGRDDDALVSEKDFP